MKLILGTCLILLLNFSMSAATFNFATPAGSSVSDGAVNATASFTTGAGTVTLTLTDLLANPTSVGQLISDIFFQVNNGATALTTGSVTSSSGNEITVNGNGTTTTGATGVSAGYVLTNSAGVFHLDDLAGPGHAGPAHLIIGPAGPGGIYTNANGSIAGNGPHNPFLNQSATFTLSVTGATAASTISNVMFSFGTTSGVNVAGIPTTSGVPEPTSLTLLATAIVGTAFSIRRRLAKA